MSPAPMSRTRVRPTSVVIRTERLRLYAAVLPRSPSPNESFGLADDAWKAGVRPKITPVKTETIKPKRRTPRSIVTSLKLLKTGGAIAIKTGMAQSATKIPSAPPMTASKILSVRSCLTSRLRSAPSAARMETSRARAAPRASWRLAIFAQPISNRKPTAAPNIMSAERMPLTLSSCKRVAVAPWPMLSFG